MKTKGYGCSRVGKGKGTEEVDKKQVLGFITLVQRRHSKWISLKGLSSLQQERPTLTHEGLF
jgi:hypothetical protein